MKSRLSTAAVSALLSLCLSGSVLALDGEPFMHDPSTVIQCDGKFYTYGTGGSPLVLTQPSAASGSKEDAGPSGSGTCLIQTTILIRTPLLIHQLRDRVPESGQDLAPVTDRAVVGHFENICPGVVVDGHDLR